MGFGSFPIGSSFGLTDAVPGFDLSSVGVGTGFARSKGSSPERKTDFPRVPLIFHSTRTLKINFGEKRGAKIHNSLQGLLVRALGSLWNGKKSTGKLQMEQNPPKNGEGEEQTREELGSMAD